MFKKHMKLIKNKDGQVSYQDIIIQEIDQGELGEIKKINYHYLIKITILLHIKNLMLIILQKIHVEMQKGL